MEKLDFGSVKTLTVRCLSEVAWRDTARMKQDIVDAGGFATDQFDVRWTPGNAAGVTVLLTAVDGAGTAHTFLMDTGWDPQYVGEVFRREGVAERIASGEVEFLFVTHEHIDHFWGVPAVVALRPDIRILLPAGVSDRSREMLLAAGHTGEVVEMAAGEAHVLFPGCAAVTFDVGINLKAHGEQVLYFHVEGKGLVTVTGCCHPGIVALLNHAREHFAEPEIHAVYGGLHIAPFDEWNETHEKLLDAIERYGVGKWACNHCTGLLAIRRMRERGMNVVGGSGSHGSRSALYIGNGDTISF